MMDAQERNDAEQTPDTGSTPDTPTTAPEQATPTLQQWWAGWEAPEKEFLQLEGDRLILKGGSHYQERQLAILQPEHAAQTMEELRAKFSEASQRMEKLQADWEASEDVLKLQSRVRGMRDFLTHLQAAGNMEPLFAQLAAWEETLKGRLAGNVLQREEIVARAEELSESTHWKDTAQQFRELEEKWKQAPNIEKAQSDTLRQRLDAAKDKFYERRRQHQEEVEKDMAQSLDLKLEIVEKAERLAASEAWKATTEAFRELLEQWKQTGKTFTDKQEELWQRFNQAKTAFYERKRLHHQEIQSEQEENYEKKLALVTQAEALQHQTNWQATARQLEQIQQEWNRIGRVPQEKSEELWQRLHKAKDTFYGNRRQHNEQLMGQLQENLSKKQALIQRAEDVSRSTEWREGTEEMNELMAQWKKIGPAPREQNEIVWEQFLAARKKFFERKDASREQHKARIVQQHDRRLNQTRNFLATLESELKEEQEKLADFQESLDKLTSGPKEEELRRHLKNLIGQSEKNMERRMRKIEEVREQLSSLQQRPERERPREQERSARQSDERAGKTKQTDPVAEETAPQAASAEQVTDDQQEQSPEANKAAGETRQPESTEGEEA